MLQTIRKWVKESENIVFFGGAGVSTESGIPDFRGVDGLYHQKFDFPPETILSRSFFESNPEEFFRFYRDKMMPLGYSPNITHIKLTQWEQEGKLKAIITQNIDGLHQKAGSRNVFELHGSVLRNRCQRCQKAHSAAFIRDSAGVPRCACGGIVEPAVVLYGDPLDKDVLYGAMDAIADADMLIVGGTSLSVYPAAGLIDYYRGNKLVLVNQDPTPLDDRADIVLHCSLGDLFSRL